MTHSGAAPVQELSDQFRTRVRLGCHEALCRRGRSDRRRAPCVPALCARRRLSGIALAAHHGAARAGRRLGHRGRRAQASVPIDDAGIVGAPSREDGSAAGVGLRRPVCRRSFRADRAHRCRAGLGVQRGGRVMVRPRAAESAAPDAGRRHGRLTAATVATRRLAQVPPTRSRRAAWPVGQATNAVAGGALCAGSAAGVATSRSRSSPITYPRRTRSNHRPPRSVGPTT